MHPKIIYVMLKILRTNNRSCFIGWRVYNCSVVANGYILRLSHVNSCNALALSAKCIICHCLLVYWFKYDNASLLIIHTHLIKMNRLLFLVLIWKRSVDSRSSRNNFNSEVTILMRTWRCSYRLEVNAEDQFQSRLQENDKSEWIYVQNSSVCRCLSVFMCSPLL